MPAFLPPSDTGFIPEGFAWLPAFGPGVHLMTPEGELPVEWLATGDRLITRDHGAQPILWLARTRIPPARLAIRPALAPLVIDEGALGQGFPTHPTRLAPGARVLLSGWEVALNTGAEDGLAAIGDLAEPGRIAPDPYAEGTHYTAVLLPMQALVQANGLWTATLLLDAETRTLLAGRLPQGLADREDIDAGHAVAARPYLADWEVTALRGARESGDLAALLRHAA